MCHVLGIQQGTTIVFALVEPLSSWGEIHIKYSFNYAWDGAAMGK